jgi:plasmid stabilization system protein ParE
MLLMRAYGLQFQIYEYIGAESRDAAARFCDALLNHIELPATFPHIGVARTPSRGVRSVLHTPVRTYYRVDEARQCVEVIHFRHTARRDPRDK